MWITREVYTQLVEEARRLRVAMEYSETALAVARDEARLLREERAAERARLEDDRDTLRAAVQTMHRHVEAQQGEATALAKTIASDATRAIVTQQTLRRELQVRVAVADVNFGWCRQLVNQLQATNAALLEQRGIIVPRVSLSPPAPPVAGMGVPGPFTDDIDPLTGAMGLSFEDVGDEAARAMKIEHDDTALDGEY